MDLYAYSQMEDYEHLLVENNIEIPRLRGIRKMSEEEIITEETIKQIFEDAVNDIAGGLCRCSFRLDSNWHSYSKYTDKLKSYYVPNDVIMWDRWHGRKRRNLKFEIKKMKKNVRKQYETFNKYVGREDVLMIHSRIGARNWNYYNEQFIEEYGKGIKEMPWFLEIVEDWYDGTYVDIYVKIGD